MKLGLLISVVIVALFVAALVTMNRGGEVEGPTAATGSEHLERSDLPADLPAPYEAFLSAAHVTEADAAEVYERAVRHFRRHEGALARERARRPEAPVRELTALVVEGMYAGRVSEGFLDRYLPLEPGAQPRVGPAMEWIRTIVLDEARRLSETGEGDASEAALAVWVLGQRAFEHNVRLPSRLDGLAMMAAAGMVLAEQAEEDARLDVERLGQWVDALRGIEQAWQPKLTAMLSVEPHVGDLMNFAHHDADRTFRVAATLRLGIARHTAPGSADRATAERAIEQLRDSDDPLIAEAAAAAAAFTREDLRRLR